MILRTLRRLVAACALPFVACALLFASAGAAFAQPRAAGAKPRSAGVLLVAGASGQTGRHAVRFAREQGYIVRGTTRDVARARREVGEIEWFEADVRDPKTLAPAFRGAEYVISAIGARTWEGPESPQFIDYQGVVNLVDAAKATGVRHFVLISSAAAGSHRDQSQSTRLGGVLQWKTRGEEYLKASGVPYTIIGPAGLTDDPPLVEGLRAVRRESYQSSSVARGDVGRVAVAALKEASAARKSFALYNDAGAQPETWRTDLHGMAPDAVAPRTATPLDALAWLAGHWLAEGSGRIQEELWLTPRGGLMLGLNREIGRSGRATFEFLRIEARGDRIVYLASPAGRPPTEFRMTESGGERVVFENPGHDFPRTLTYRREGIVLRARAEGVEQGNPRAIDYEWRLIGFR
jgi:uncharacterized protein YbjT (DUF2867 family)